MDESQLKQIAKGIKLVVTDIDGVHTADTVMLFGTPEPNKPLLFDLHLPGKSVRLQPYGEDKDVHDYYFASGDDGRIEGYQFFTQDGLAFKECMRHDIPVVFLSGRNSPAVRQRAIDLGVEYHLGVKDKCGPLEQKLKDMNITWQEVLFIGNDIQDLSLLRKVGFSAAPADAVKEVKDVALHVSDRPGGSGAIRSIIEFMFEAKGLWKEIVERNRTLG